MTDARRSDCGLAPWVAVALANAVRAYYSGRWNDWVGMPRARAIDYSTLDDPGGLTLLDTLTREQMQAALERVKLFRPTAHRTLLQGLGNKLDPSRARPYYLALCALWEELRKVVEG